MLSSFSPCVMKAIRGKRESSSISMPLQYPTATFCDSAAGGKVPGNFLVILTMDSTPPVMATLKLLTIAHMPCSNCCVIQIYPKQVYMAKAAAVPAGLNKLPKVGEPIDWRMVYLWPYRPYGLSGWHASRICVLLPFQLPAKMALKVGYALYKSLFHRRRPTHAAYILAFSFCLLVCRDQKRTPGRQVLDFVF